MSMSSVMETYPYFFIYIFFVVFRLSFIYFAMPLNEQFYFSKKGWVGHQSSKSHGGVIGLNIPSVSSHRYPLNAIHSPFFWKRETSGTVVASERPRPSAAGRTYIFLFLSLSLFLYPLLFISCVGSGGAAGL